MFGRRKKQRDQRLLFEGASFMTVGQATTAVRWRHSDPDMAARYPGNGLLGAMAAYGIGPEGTDDERYLWELQRGTLGGPAMVTSWQIVAGLPLDVNATLEISGLIVPALNSAPSDKVEEISEGILCGSFGRSDPQELNLTERMMCHITGLSLKAMMDDAVRGPAEQVDDRVDIGAKIVTAYGVFGARVEALRQARERG